MVAYTGVAFLTMAVTLGLLAVTKIPVVVTLVAATLIAGGISIVGRMDLGYWDPFALLTFVFLWFFAAIVSLAFLGLGKWQKWPFFLSERSAQPMDEKSAL